MNERIRELAEQAGLSYMPSDYPDMADLYKGADFELEKFAELIIAKCIEAAGDPADGLIKDDTWHDGVRASVWSIQQYFGVKE